MGKRLNVKSGDRYGRWVVTEEAEHSSHGARRFRCKCDCGTVSVTQLTHLIQGVSKSCGCHRKELYTTHGQTDSRLYQIWASMKSRCQSSGNSNYDRYGGRGIVVCKEWQSFKPFMRWALINGYNDNLTIERINNDSNYEPQNCKWISQSEQCQNRKGCNYVTYKGTTKNLTQWATKLGIHRAALYYRLSSGWDIEKAFTTPSQRSARC